MRRGTVFRRAVIPLVLFLALSCSACAEKPTFSAGTPLSQEELDALREEMAQPTLPEGETGDLYPVYFVTGGSAYHLNAACSYLKNSKVVREGTLTDAVEAGVTHACSRCALGGSNP